MCHNHNNIQRKSCASSGQFTRNTRTPTPCMHVVVNGCVLCQRSETLQTKCVYEIEAQQLE